MRSQSDSLSFFLKHFKSPDLGVIILIPLGWGRTDTSFPYQVAQSFDCSGNTHHCPLSRNSVGFAGVVILYTLLYLTVLVSSMKWHLLCCCESLQNEDSFFKGRKTKLRKDAFLISVFDQPFVGSLTFRNNFGIESLSWCLFCYIGVPDEGFISKHANIVPLTRSPGGFQRLSWVLWWFL